MEENTEDYLLEVRKPARYIGREFNSVVKKINSNTFNIVLCFPDAYEVGMSHLGIKVLYHILNKQEEVFCQRCFAPWLDMEELMRKRNLPLLSLESQRPLSDFDVLGFSLQYELGFTNVLNMLELGGIPIYAKDRAGLPIVIAGGPCCYNPEPMAEFIDVFVIGEAEEVIIELVNKCREFKKSFEDLPEAESLSQREKLLRELAKIEGVYVPTFTETPKRITRRYVENFEETEVPTAPPVPFVEVIHDRISLEIMRGCPNQCYFCQAGFTINPVRMRSVDKVLELAKKTYRNTGFEKIAFCALSSANYPNLKKLITQMHSFCRERGLGISLPSLRIDKDFSEILAMIGDLKKTGLTFAPEAGSERLRKLINKNIDIQSLKDAVLAAHKIGWKKLKLYFMIGLPTEDNEDLENIVSLVKEFTYLRKSVDSRLGQINVSISNFIPKAHTPFQWLGMNTPEELAAKQQYLRSRLSAKNLKVSFHDVRMSFLEAYLTRGDRQLHKVIFKAYTSGARFDAWSESFNFALWQEAFKEHDIDPRQYVCQKRDISQDLPWEYIDCGIPSEVLRDALRKSGI
ncbi:MAG: TIGR03960 family B12-binding radical SAM protein [Candidatus Omnitrophota bacterium]